MKKTKTCFIEGLIQHAILLGLLHVRVDVESCLNSLFNSPLLEMDGGPLSAFVQTPFHHYSDFATGHHVHPKWPVLEEDLTRRRILQGVRALGEPARFPTRLGAWLVHLVPKAAEPGGTPNSTGYPGQGDSSDELRENESYNHRVSCLYYVSVNFPKVELDECH